MSEIGKIIKDLRNRLIDEVEAEKVFLLENELVKLFPASHGERDKFHMIYARCVRDLVWLGWVSEAKKNRGNYSLEVCKALERSLKEAFTIGKKYLLIM